MSEVEGSDVTAGKWRFICRSCVGGYGEAEMQGNDWVLWEWDSKNQLRLDHRVLRSELSGTETAGSIFFSSSSLLQLFEEMSSKGRCVEVLAVGCHYDKSLGCWDSVLEGDYGNFWSFPLFFLAHEVNGFALPGTPAMLGYITPSPKQWSQLTTDNYYNHQKCELNNYYLFESGLS